MKNFNSFPKKILITGGCGFIGSHLVERLIHNKHQITILDDLSAGRLSNIAEFLNCPNLKFVKGSVLDRELVMSLLNPCDIIFHLASTVGMQQVYKEPEYSYEVSKVGTEHVMMAPLNVPIILFSSSAVYGQSGEHKVSVNQTITLQNALEYDGKNRGYAAGKFTLETIGTEQMKLGRPVMIVRPFNVVGIRQTPTYGMVLPSFVNMISRGRPLTIYNDGCQTRSFACVEKFTQVLCDVIENSKAWMQNHNVINIGSDESISINTLAEKIIQKTVKQTKKVYISYQEVFPNKVDVKHRKPDLKSLHDLVGPIEWPLIDQIIDKVIEEDLYSLQGSADQVVFHPY